MTFNNLPKIFMVISVLFTIQLYAGQEGNGGFGIECPGKPVEILDLYEAENRYHYKVDLGAANLSVDDKLKILFKRWKGVSPKIAEHYEKLSSEFFQKHAAFLGTRAIYKNDEVILDGKVLPPLDVGKAEKPSHCKWVPMARNIKPTSTRERPINVFDLHYNSADRDSQAILRLHELVSYYGDYATEEAGYERVVTWTKEYVEPEEGILVISGGGDDDDGSRWQEHVSFVPSSEKIREMMALLASHELDLMNPEQYRKETERIGVFLFEEDGYIVKDDVRIDAPNRVQFLGVSVEIEQSPSRSLPLALNQSLSNLLSGGKIEYASDGTPLSFRILLPLVVTTPFIQFETKNGRTSQMFVQLYKDKQTMMLTFDELEKFKFGDIELLQPAGEEISFDFYPDGKLRCIISKGHNEEYEYNNFFAIKGKPTELNSICYSNQGETIFYSGRTATIFKVNKKDLGVYYWEKLEDGFKIHSHAAINLKNVVKGLPRKLKKGYIKKIDMNGNPRIVDVCADTYDWDPIPIQVMTAAGPIMRDIRHCGRLELNESGQVTAIVEM